MTTERFILHNDKIFEAWDSLDDPPYISYESPARSIEEMLYEWADRGALSVPEGFAISAIPLTYEYDPDQLLVVVYRPGRPALAQAAMDWDDFAPRDSYGREITADELVETLGYIVTLANELLDEEYKR